MSLSKPFKNYSKWVVDNPQKCALLESGLKCVSFFRWKKDTYVSSELLSACGNILTMVNDDIFLKAHSSNCIESEGCMSYIMRSLAVLEYCEVIMEMASGKLFGKKGKWAAIALVQTVKFLLRASLIFLYKQRLIPDPAVPSLDRMKLVYMDSMKSEMESEVFQIRSGRVIRTLRSSDYGYMRDWDPPKLPEISQPRVPATHKCALAEMMYISKPLLHLALVYICGTDKFEPWAMSLLWDWISLKIYDRECYHLLNDSEKKELRERYVSILMYLIKSPFYEKFVQKRLTRLLELVSKEVPLTHYCINPLLSQLPFYRTIYFYFWSR